MAAQGLSLVPQTRQNQTRRTTTIQSYGVGIHEALTAFFDGKSFLVVPNDSAAVRRVKFDGLLASMEKDD